jgi:hypothetical protein
LLHITLQSVSIGFGALLGTAGRGVACQTI